MRAFQILELYEDEDQTTARFALGGAGDPGVFVSAFHLTPQLETWARTQSAEIAKRIARDWQEAHSLTNKGEVMFAELLAWAFVVGLPHKIHAALGEMIAESVYYVESIAREMINQDSALAGNAPQLPNIKNEVRSFARSMTRERETFLLKSIEKFISPNWREIATERDRLRPIWEESKIVYEQNKTRSNWQEFVTLATKDKEELPADLIASLSGDLTNFPEDLQAKWSEKLGETKPAYIALHHAARLRGVQPYSLSTSRMYQLIREHSGGVIDGDKELHSKEGVALKREHSLCCRSRNNFLKLFETNLRAAGSAAPAVGR